MNQELLNYIRNAKNNGASDESIRSTLKNEGWDDEPINRTFDLIYHPELQNIPKPGVVKKVDASKPVPAPETNPLTIKDLEQVLFYGLLLIAVFSGAQVLHNCINYFIPEWGVTFDPEFQKWYLATFIVSFPIFATSFYFVEKMMFANIEQRFTDLRKGLTITTLAVTLVFGMYNLIYALYKILGNQATLNYIFHFIVTFVISVSLFSYFYFDYRKDKSQNGK